MTTLPENIRVSAVLALRNGHPLSELLQAITDAQAQVEREAAEEAARQEMRA